MKMIPEIFKDHELFSSNVESTSFIETTVGIEWDIISFLKSNGFDFGVSFPCSKLRKLLKQLGSEDSIRVVSVTREEEGVGVCAGAFLAGKKPFMLIQSSGLGNSFNAMASLLKTYRIPLLILASYRGFHKEKIPAQVPLGEAVPGMLNALNIPFIILQDHFARVQQFSEQCFKNDTPHVVLMSPRLFEN